MDERDWELLVDKVNRRQCTPFLGAGVSYPSMPTGAELSEELATRYPYPLTDKWNLPRVAQYVATTFDAEFVKARVAERVLQREKERAPDFSDPEQPHRILADLRLPLYLTTNYDPLLSSAFEAVGVRPTVRVSRWNFETRSEPGITEPPSSVSPLVFHLHGIATNIPSMVLTEDDYVDFMTEAQVAPEDVVPLPIRTALATTNLLFVGYSLHDWNFRVLLRSLMRKVQKTSQRFNMSVQMKPAKDLVVTELRQEAEKFLCDYLETEKVTVHWGDAGEFLRDLRRRCQQARAHV